MHLGFDIVFQDNSLVVINKPPGLLSVPGRLPENFDSVALRLQQIYPSLKIVHRLDCDTSGLMVLAFDADTHRELSRQFHDREVNKTYNALVYGQLRPIHGRVELALRYDPEHKPRHCVDPVHGKASLTLWNVLDYTEQHTQVELTPWTGRSHQLRVHMLALGHPILGDVLYAHDEALRAAPRLCLHASILEFSHPALGQRVRFQSPPPF